MIIGYDMRFADYPNGVGVVTRELGISLSNINSCHKLIYFAYPDSIVPEENKNTRICYFRKMGSYGTWTQCILPFLAKKEKIDLLINPLSSFPVLRKGKQMNIVYDLCWLNTPDDYSFVSRIKHKFWLTQALKKSSHIVCISGTVKDQLISFFPDIASRISFTHLGISSDFLNMNLPITEQPDSKYFISTGGASLPRKHFEKTVHAFNIFRNRNGREWKLFVTGTIHEKYAPLFAENPWIIKLGRVDQQKLVKLYNEATAAIYLSSQEGFGLPVAEAFSCNTAVIASPETPSVKELFSTTVLKANPNDENECSLAFEKIAIDKNFRREMVEKGNTIASKLSWNTIAAQYLQIIDHI